MEEPFNTAQLAVLADLKKELKDEMAELRKELKDEMAELKKELKDEMAKLRGLFRTKWTPDMTCAICLDGMEPGYHSKTKCGHVFHKECILQYYNNFSTMCPMCRGQCHPIKRHELQNEPDRSGEMVNH